MKSPKLSALHVHIIGGVVFLLLGLILFFGMIKPKNQDTETAKAAASAAEGAGGTDSALSKAKKDLVSAKQDTVKINSDWSIYARKYMPNYNLDKDPLVAYFGGGKGQKLSVNDIPAEEGTWITKWYDAQRSEGITRAEGVEFPIGPLATDPNGVASLTSITFPGGKQPWNVTLVCKSFDQAMAHIRRINGMTGHGMPVISEVALSGQSPELTLSYTLAMYVIPWTAPPAADTRIGAGGGGGTGGGAGIMGGGPANGMGGMGGKSGMSGPATGGPASGGGPGSGSKKGGD